MNSNELLHCRKKVCGEPIFRAEIGAEKRATQNFFEFKKKRKNVRSYLKVLNFRTFMFKFLVFAIFES